MVCVVWVPFGLWVCFGFRNTLDLGVFGWAGCVFGFVGWFVFGLFDAFVFGLVDCSGGLFWWVCFLVVFVVL